MDNIKIIEPKLFQLFLSLYTGPIGLIYVLVQKKWADKTKLTLILLQLFWPLGLYYLFNESGFSEDKRGEVMLLMFAPVFIIIGFFVINFLIGVYF